MDAPRFDRARARQALALGVWENEGGAPATAILDHQFGRRIESDRSWTVYHVFTGVPARRGGAPMTGLSRSEATDGMVSLNRLDARVNARRRRERELPASSSAAVAADEAPTGNPPTDTAAPDTGPTQTAPTGTGRRS
ncbi:hypothetical protein [Prosthecodimorpha staleyi]|uniref:hypothetical protein n=1 Tax=Prosthecodimorpha staleyi TaxID=2840188 RepID=UPI0028F6D4F6|nr:hypothetical protein [Prosthecodimorpha staleyi]